MDEDKSTPDAPVDDTGGEKPTQTSEEQAPAEQSEDKASQDESTPTDTQDELSSFAKGQGFSEDDLKNPAVQKALSIAQKNRNTATETYKRQTELEKKLQGIGEKAPAQDDDEEYSDPLEAAVAEHKKEQAQTKWENAVTMFMAKNPDAFDLVETMDEIAEAKPHLAKDLDTLYEMAKFRSLDPDSIKDQGRREAEERLAKGQQAGAPSRSASNSAPSGSKGFTRSQIANMSRSEYEENREAIIAAEQAGTVVEDI